MPRRTGPTKWQRQRDSHAVTSYPRLSRCGNCGAVVLAGNLNGLMTLYDPYVLSQVGEAEALIRQLRTFHAHHPNFDRRTYWAIRNNPVPRTGHVVREHRCDTPPPQQLALRSAAEQQLPDECPF
jgi:ribosomal protein L32